MHLRLVSYLRSTPHLRFPAALAILYFASIASAQITANSVVSYNSGAIGGVDAMNEPLPGNVVAGYNNSSGALGLPTADTGFGMLTPFNAAFSTDQITGIGAGGSLVLQFSQPVPTNGVTIGVHAAVGMIDNNFPDGQAGDGSVANPLFYTFPRASDVMVGQAAGNSINWVDLGTINFDIPTNYYSQGITTPGEQFTAGTQVADFAQPFTGSEASFENLDWNGVLANLNGSAGGQWLDLSGTGLSSVSYIEFSEPANSSNSMYVDSVVAVPEPAMVGLLLLSGTVLLRRRNAAR